MSGDEIRAVLVSDEAVDALDDADCRHQNWSAVETGVECECGARSDGDPQYPSRWMNEHRFRRMLAAVAELFENKGETDE